MGIRLKLNLVLLAMAAIGMGLFALVAWPFLTTMARDEVLVRTRIVMESAAGIRQYTSEEIAPLLNTRLDDRFHVQAVSAYAANRNLTLLHKQFPEYSYREAALNPTNPRDRATESEADIINDFRSNSAKKELLTERETHKGLILYLSRPLVATENCLVCHDTPERAPPAMLEQYGRQNGFGWKLNEVVGAQIVSIPLNAVLSHAHKTLNLFLLLLGATFAVLIVVINVLIEIMIIRPVVRMSRIANEVSMGKQDVEEYVKKGSDEVASLTVSFNRMKRSLAEAVKLIESSTR